MSIRTSCLPPAVGPASSESVVSATGPETMRWPICEAATAAVGLGSGDGLGVVVGSVRVAVASAGAAVAVGGWGVAVGGWSVAVGGSVVGLGGATSTGPVAVAGATAAGASAGGWVAVGGGGATGPTSAGVPTASVG